MSTDVQPFNIHVSDDILTDLKARLERARYPVGLNLPPGEEWSYGTPTSVVKELVDYWKTEFDWRKVERELNDKLPQFITPIDAGERHGQLNIHFVHKRSSRPDAIPLLFAHGFPGQFVEVLKILPLLTSPASPDLPAFHIVAPSLPGYAFSESSSLPGVGLKVTADIFNKLMKKLGYETYLAQGGDWGSFIVRSIAMWHHSNCKGVHTNLFATTAPTLTRHPLKLVKTILGFMGLPGGYSQREVDGLKKSQAYSEGESGYMEIQSTRPQTLGYSLTDSPVALLAWIREKLHTWTDSYPWTPEEVLTWVMLYWISTSGPIGSIRFYKEAKIAGMFDPSKTGGATDGNNNATTLSGKFGSKDDPGAKELGLEWNHVMTAWCDTPLGVSLFPKEIAAFPDDWPHMVQPLKMYKRHDRGGHFAAWEVPDLLAADIQEFAAIILKDNPQLVGQ